MAGKNLAVDVLKAAYERDPEELDPLEMRDYFRSAIKSSLYLLGVEVDDVDYTDPEVVVGGLDDLAEVEAGYGGEFRCGW